MKLELKHLVGYLPYNAKILDFVNGGNCIINDTYVLEPKNCHRCLTFAEETEKPILRPLSDLTKENVLEMIECSDFESIYFNENPIDLIFINTEDKTYLSDIIRNMDFLFKNHFDIYGLIENGLAIDINTLK